MYAASVPVAVQALDQALVLLDHATPQMLTATLHPGMFDCATQFAMVADFALRATHPLIGRDVPDVEVVEDLEGLRRRLVLVRAEVMSLTPETFADAATRRITHQAGFADLEQSGAEYLQHFALPNLWFHLSMAFAILRAQGAPVGKAEFDGLHVYPPGFSW